MNKFETPETRAIINIMEISNTVIIDPVTYKKIYTTFDFICFGHFFTDCCDLIDITNTSAGILRGLEYLEYVEKLSKDLGKEVKRMEHIGLNEALRKYL